MVSLRAFGINQGQVIMIRGIEVKWKSTKVVVGYADEKDFVN